MAVFLTYTFQTQLRYWYHEYLNKKCPWLNARDPVDVKSTIFQIMAWCRQAANVNRGLNNYFWMFFWGDVGFLWSSWRPQGTLIYTFAKSSQLGLRLDRFGLGWLFRTWRFITIKTTSNGSWCIGIKGEMSGTVCVTFTWDIYIYIWVVYSFCLFCCLFIIVTWWYMWCIVWQVASKRKYMHVW